MDGARVAAHARRCGIGLSRGAADALAAFLSEVQRYNERLNLVADASTPTLLRRHLIDSVLGIHALECTGVVRGCGPEVIDLGSGGGFPGVVAAILRPQWNVGLLDSSARKVGFLVHVTGQLNRRNLHVVHSRAEDLPRGPFGSLLPVDGILSRAVAPARTLARWSGPLLRDGGWCGWWKGPRARREMEEAAPLMEKYGLEMVSRVVYRLPGQSISREIIAVRRACSSGGSDKIRGARSRAKRRGSA